MIDAPDWFVYAFDLLIFVVVILGLVFLKAWWNTKTNKGKLIAEIWEPSGFATREKVKPDPDGQTVTVSNIVYMLPKEISEKERLKELEKAKDEGKPVSESHSYPRRRWIYIPNWPLPPIPMRVESWERDNPEPIRPFYGRVDDNGKFVESQLTVTGSEWAAHRSKITAIGIAQDANERAARDKEWLKGMANMPNKMLIYIGLGALLILQVINLLIGYQG